jgi:DNA-binding PadR family transcriptional regulator
MDVTAHLPLAPRDLVILSVLVEGPLHGYGIIKAVEARSAAGVLLDPANLYRVLRRMRALRWIQDVDGDDERRRTYRITRDGRTVLAAELGRLESLLAQAKPAVAGEP